MYDSSANMSYSKIKKLLKNEFTSHICTMSGNLTEKENLVRPGESIFHCNEWKVLYISDNLKDFGFNI